MRRTRTIRSIPSIVTIVATVIACLPAVLVADDSTTPIPTEANGSEPSTNPGDSIDPEPPSPAPAPSTRVAVQRGRVRVLRQAILASDRIGVVAAELPREGDRVESGNVVVRLEDKLQRAALKVARARADNEAPVAAAQREYDVSVAEVQAAEDANLQVENAIPEIEVERLRLARDRNSLRIQQAKNTRTLDELEHGRLTVELETFEIRTPFGGTVTKVHRTIGEAVRQGDPILEIVDAERMRVEGFVPVADALRVKRGDQVVVRPILQGFVPPEGKETTTGELVFVDVAVQPVTGLVRVWADVANPHGYLLDGLDAEMTIEVDSAGLVERRPEHPAAVDLADR